jgi:hypothetical protein
MLKNKKIMIPGIVAVVMLVLAFAFYTLAVGGQQSTLDKANEKYAQLSNRKGMLQAALAADNASAVRSGTGMDAQRKAADDGAAEELAKLVTTWDSKKSYDAARGNAISKYGLKANGTFMKTFMPEVVEVGSADGKGTTNEIDANGSNMTYQDMHSYVTRISGDKYTYLAIVNVSGSNRAGSTATKSLMFTYQTDMNHKLTQIEGYRLA